MPFDYPNLEIVRPEMVVEIEADRANSAIYISSRLTDAGVKQWPELLLRAAQVGDSDSLAQELGTPGLLNEYEVATRNGKMNTKRVPVSAAETLAEGEFNRYYLRGLARIALATGQRIEIYRGRASVNPRSSSTAAEGNVLDPSELLVELRSNVRVDVALGLPPGPNSGLTGRLQ